MGRVHLKAGTLTAPLPTVMVTVGDKERANIITVAWTGILSTHPARAYISVRPTRYSYTMLGVGREFVINLTTKELLYATDFSGIYTGARVDKFERLGLHKAESGSVAPPTVAESPLALECRVCEVLKMGTHDVFIADIVGVSVDEGIVDGEGKIHLERAGLIAYAHGEYYALGEVLGKFGMSAVKKKNAPKRTSRKSAEKAPTATDKAVSEAPRDKSEKTKSDTNQGARGTSEGARPKKGSRTPLDATGGKEPFYIGALKYKKRRGGK